MWWTGWLKTFDGARCDVLVRLALPPCLEGRGLQLSATGDDVAIWSSREDEDRLSHLTSALRRLQCRCEDTAQHTDVSIQFWLRSSDPTRPYKAPFELVGRQSMAWEYWQLFLWFLCFSFWLWRLPEAARASLCRRSMTSAQRATLQAAWHALGQARSDRTDQLGVAEPRGWGSSDVDDSSSDSASNSEFEMETRGTAAFFPGRQSSAWHARRRAVVDDNDNDDKDDDDNDEDDDKDRSESDTTDEEDSSCPSGGGDTVTSKSVR
ncbi:hypothetical protein EV182_007184 [Spiromyces aspiralis]|uniref:Uncharacterized protein n=1 Tax=Spiromyces aspiralis TaxID=68401 RepID=A0ACC1HMQ1_9FUNG|nr:hypothetical protein EV182_007184 [Spiromyces aspiralis]